MARLNPGFSDEEFVGYLMRGAPENRPRLWFLDRLIMPLVTYGEYGIADTRTREWDSITETNTGLWTVNIPRDTRVGLDWPPTHPNAFLPGIHLRWQSTTGQPWTAVWMLTETIIEHVMVAGRDDDVWRLGVWPD